MVWTRAERVQSNGTREQLELRGPKKSQQEKIEKEQEREIERAQKLLKRWPRIEKKIRQTLPSGATYIRANAHGIQGNQYSGMHTFVCAWSFVDVGR